MRLQPGHSKSTQTLTKLPNMSVQVKLKVRVNSYFHEYKKNIDVYIMSIFWLFWMKPY